VLPISRKNKNSGRHRQKCFDHKGKEGQRGSNTSDKRKSSKKSRSLIQQIGSNIRALMSKTHFTLSYKEAIL
jgi:hypothetical protein